MGAPDLRREQPLRLPRSGQIIQRVKNEAWGSDISPQWLVLPRGWRACGWGRVRAVTNWS